MLNFSTEYKAPGDGLWLLDNSHFYRPASPYVEKLFTESVVKGLKESSAKYGLILSHLDYAYVNGFFYKKIVLCSSNAAEGEEVLSQRISRGIEAIEKKLWREDLKIWDSKVKPSAIRRNDKIQAVDITALSDSELVDHLTECYENALYMMYLHHVYTVPCVLPIGLYLVFCQEKGGIAPPEALSLLAGSTSISLGIAENTLRRLASNMREDNIDPRYFTDMKKEDILSEIILRAGSNTKKELNNYFNLVGNRLVTGYDITDNIGNDMPDVLIDNILSHLNESIDLNNDELDMENMKKYESIISRIPSEHHVEFNQLLHEARLLNRLRDERSLYTDVLATGLARRALKHAGERLHEMGKIEDPSLVLYATNEEVCGLLTGRVTVLSSSLMERRDWCVSQRIENAPIVLGKENDISQGKAGIEDLPEIARLSLSAIAIVLKEVYEEPTFVEEGSTFHSKLRGSPVSPGIYEGVARIIHSVEDFSKIQKGDVLVTRSTTASYNVILPLLGAIVTDRGGQLSHAAIVAREFGIPSVVGTRDATQVIEDGCRIRVDGDNGSVERVI
ncbi:hypothetical protein C6H64_11690 [Photorhabdus luminescens]|uniref:PEP-utilizing enzyme n=1 Tax=Photorhabdus akhurstii TaxID=171438 RepID=UPI000CF8D094|nr:hypothetical protein C6H69_23015 [Photorhabdus luminescens]PQQ29836.1 hypothetical protein C6H64_11690 [Photorhabdus luminescens]